MHLYLKRQICSYTAVVPSRTEKLYPIPDQNGQNVYPFLDRNGAIPILFGEAHTYMAYVREVLPHMVKTKMIS